MRAAVGVCILLGFGCTRDEPKLRVVPGRICEPFGTIASLKLGMSIADANASTELTALGDAGDARDEVMKAAHAGAPHSSGLVTFWRGHLREISLLIYEPISWLFLAWGPGTPTIPVVGEEHYVYLDATQTIRCVVSSVGDSYVMYFEPVTPLATFLGNGATLGFVGVPLLGRTVAELDDAFGKLGFRLEREQGTHVAIASTVSEWGHSPPLVRVTPGADGKVARATIEWYIETAGGKAATFALLEAKFGKPSFRDGSAIFTVEGQEGSFDISAEIARLTVGR